MRLSAVGFVVLSTLCIVSVAARGQDAHDHAQGQNGGQYGQGVDYHDVLLLECFRAVTSD